MAKFQYGGQAVIEGVMMMGPQSRAIAVRLPEGKIEVDEKEVNLLVRRYKFFKLPLVRGVVSLINSLVIGTEALNYSANQALGEEEELSPWSMALTFIIAFAVAAVFFVALPTGAASLTQDYIDSNLLKNVIEGIVRLGLFLAYVFLIGKIQDIKRVFQYHGAEHKVINAYESGEELKVEKVQKYPTFHPRCGTSFIVIVMILTIFVFCFIDYDVLWKAIVYRICLLPVIAGISYELLKYSAKLIDRKSFCFLLAPGRWVQKLTTNEPDDQQVEVAIAAFKAAYREGENVC